MPGETASGGVDWGPIRLVVFDVDGTLYRQRPLRLAMLKLLARDALRSRSLTTIRVISDYRRERERLADARTEAFEPKLVADVAERAGITPAAVERIVADWIETRPLPFLKAAMVPGTAALFAAIRRSGRALGALSDYPAVAKLEALGLAVDHVVAAGDAGIGMMKPDPRGLNAMIAAAGVAAAETMLIGDRPERDGGAARAAGAHALIRSGKPLAGWTCFADFRDAIFAPLLDA